jgi:hypothetical protein
MAAFAFLPALVHSACGAEAASVGRPDILLILADDLGYGQKHVQAPNIDRLAAEGMEFRRFYAGATVSAQLADDRTASRPHPRVRQGRLKASGPQRFWRSDRCRGCKTRDHETA